MGAYLLCAARFRDHVCKRLLIAALLLFGFEATALGQSRIIFVNGVWLNSSEIAYVDRLNCGNPVPNGNYWLDSRRREWGYVGVPGRNPLPDCSPESSQAKRSRPGDLTINQSGGCTIFRGGGETVGLGC